MRLKEIKPGMAIRCHNFEQGESVVKQLKVQGAVFLGNSSPHYTDEHCVVFFNFKNQYSFYKFYDATCDFSDLIIPELTAEEVWLGIASVDDDEIFEYFQCDGFETRETLIKNAGWKDLVAIVEKHIADHEKKEPEIETEWFWQGRIFQICKDGCYYQIKDGTGFYDTGCEYRESAEEYMVDELKEYCKTHEGEFIAVVEQVCRVKK